MREIAAGVRCFDYRLAQMRRFPVALYLAPDPDVSFSALTDAVWRAFPDHPPFEGKFDTVVPHVTVAHGDEPQLCEIEVELRIALPCGRRDGALQRTGAHREFQRSLGGNALFRTRRVVSFPQPSRHRLAAQSRPCVLHWRA